MKKLLLIVLLTPFLLSLNGCKNDSKRLIGTWVRTKTITSFNEIIMEEEQRIFKNSNYEFKENGKLVYNYEYESGGRIMINPHNGEWTLEKSDSDGYPFILKLRIEQDHGTHIKEIKNKLKFISETEFEMVDQEYKSKGFYSKK